MSPAKSMREHLRPLVKSQEQTCCDVGTKHGGDQKHPQSVCVPGNNCGSKLACRIEAAATLRAECASAETDQNPNKPRHERGKPRDREKIPNRENNHAPPNEPTKNYLPRLPPPARLHPPAHPRRL